MASPAVITVLKMLEALPAPAQDHVVSHLRDYLADLQEEDDWNVAFQRTQPQLIAAARQVRQTIAQGQGTPLDEHQL